MRSRLWALLALALTLGGVAFQWFSTNSSWDFPWDALRPAREPFPKLDEGGCREVKPKLTAEEARAVYQPEALDGPVYAILAVFAGRGDRMRLLLAHVDRLLQMGALQEVHLWRNTVGWDAQWLGEMAKKEKYRLFQMGKGWGSVYQHYAKFRVEGVKSRRVVVVKADDDTVWLDLARFREFVEYSAKRTDMLMVHANIVSHGITAYYQFQRPPLNATEIAEKLTSAYPPQGGFGAFFDRFNASVSMSYKVHERFLQSTEGFSWRDGDSRDCVDFRPPGSCTQARFSINFFAARLAAWKVLAGLTKKHWDDEHMVTTEASKLGHKECFFTPFNAVHLSFKMQTMNVQHLPSYKRLTLAKNLTLPPHPAPWCEEGFQHADNSEPSFLMKKGNFTARACLALCDEHAECAGVVLISRGCKLKADECHLKRQIFPVALRATACHCVLPKGARTVS